MSDQIAELKRLLAEATADPWSVEHGSLGIFISDGEDAIGEIYDGPDAALIVALRNSAAELLARIEAVELALQRCVTVMEKNIYPKPDVGADHPWAVLRDARAVLATKGADECPPPPRPNNDRYKKMMG